MTRQVVCSLIVMSILAGCEKKGGAAPPGSSVIENMYVNPGQESVATSNVADESGNNLYKIYYPAALKGVYPLITWGNGTWATAKNYDCILTHLASWGFVVVDNYDTKTGSGSSILASAQYMLQENSTPGNIFYGKIDSNKVGAAGHSQGSIGVINASTNFLAGQALIKTIVSIEPYHNKANGDPDCYAISSVVNPIFLISGTEDNAISPLSVNQTDYDSLKSGVSAAMARRIGANHNSIQDNKLQWGYLTAWLRYQLMGDTTAKAAFTGTNAEILSNTANWQNAAVKNTN